MHKLGFRHNIQYYEGKLATVYCVLSSETRLFGQAPSGGPPHRREREIERDQNKTFVAHSEL